LPYSQPKRKRIKYFKIHYSLIGVHY
jgi:hypothetical protein